MKITVTGCLGFIGTHVVNKLLKLGHEVIGVDSVERQVHGRVDLQSHFRLSDGLYTFYREPISVCDFGDESDVVIHLAAKVGIGQSMYKIEDYVASNSQETASMLESLCRFKPKRLIVASSMSVYGEGGNELVREDRPVDLRSIYALTKYDQEQMCLIWGRAYKVPTVALRFFNTYGPGQSLNNPYTGVMAIFASRLMNGNSPVIYGDGHQTRDFIHVDDVAEAVVHAALDGVTPGVYNVGTGEASEIGYIGLLLAEKLDRKCDLEFTGERAGDIRHCIADTHKLWRQGWTSRIQLRAGVTDYVRWLQNQPTPHDGFLEAHKELVVHGLTS